MRKKFLAAVLAASMVLSMAPVLPVNTGTVASAEDAVETLTGTEWWTGSQKGKDYTLTGDGTLELYVGCTANAGAFSVELVSDTNKYITTGSDINIWTAESATGTVSGEDPNHSGKVATGHQYKITITRTGSDFSIVYYDLTDDKEHCKLSATGTNMGNDVAVHVIAQVGTYMVGTAKIEMPDTTPGDTTPGDTTPGDTTPDATNGTDFSAIDTKPVVSYTFDNADGIELAGEAKVADGVLSLATTETRGTTYAKIADLSSNDFSNGITLTADVNLTGYVSDWTPIFMLGDGTLGSGKEGATIAYHFTQGFSSREDVSEVGCFGNGVAAPYTWDYFSNEANRNKWMTLGVTISNSSMITYINGVAVQTLEGDFANLLTAFKSAKNNYLGGSYWSAEGQDADFMGSMDNVGIYNTALSAEDMAALTSAEPSTPDDPGTDDPGTDDPGTDDPGTDDPTPAKKTLTLKNVKVKKNATTVTGTVSVAKATVKVKVGSKAFKKATVKAKKFTCKVAKLKKGTKVKVQVTKSGYKKLTKTYTVK